MRLVTVALLFVSFNAAVASAPAKAPAPSGEKVSRVDACKKRFAAACKLVQRCAPWAQDMGGKNCEAIDPGCAKLASTPAYQSSDVNQCVSQLESLSCPKSSLDPNDPDALDFERHASACRQLALADAKADEKAQASASARASR